MPFIIWLIIGGILLLLFSQSQLFFFANIHHHHIFDYIMIILSGFGRGDCISLILISLLIFPYYRNKKYLINIISFAAIVPLVSFLLKTYYNDPRPLTVYGIEKVHTVSLLENLFFHSFPSGHTMGGFGLFLLLSLFLPDSKKQWSLVFFILAIGCAYSRLYLGQHFFKDIYVGSMLGFGLIFVFYISTEYIYNKNNYKE